MTNLITNVLIRIDELIDSVQLFGLNERADACMRVTRRGNGILTK